MRRRFWSGRETLPVGRLALARTAAVPRRPACACGALPAPWAGPWGCARWLAGGTDLDRAGRAGGYSCPICSDGSAASGKFLGGCRDASRRLPKKFCILIFKKLIIKKIDVALYKWSPNTFVNRSTFNYYNFDWPTWGKKSGNFGDMCSFEGSIFRKNIIISDVYFLAQK